MFEPHLALPSNLIGKKIVLVNHSDTNGGAAVVSFRLMQALRARGLDVRMVVFNKASRHSAVASHGSSLSRNIRFCLERGWMLLRWGVPYANIFQVSTSEFALDICSHPWVKEADIVCLNWFNQGLMGLKGLSKLHRMGKKLIWTLHDMWAFTGICHHAYECDHYTDCCGGCMFIRGGGDFNDISHRMWKRKKRIYSRAPVTFIAVSHWLEKKARSSSLLRDKPVMTIHNAFPVESFPTRLPPGSDIPQKDVILIVAARLDDPVKGLRYSIDALNIVSDRHPDIAERTEVYLVGDMKDPSLLDSLRLSHRWFGVVRDPEMIRRLNAAAKVVLSSSLYESLQGTLIEGQAAGAIPVTFGGDGRQDIVSHLHTGYLARHRDTDDLANGIIWALRADIPRDDLHRAVEEKFGADKITDKYINLFSSLL